MHRRTEAEAARKTENLRRYASSKQGNPENKAYHPND